MLLNLENVKKSYGDFTLNCSFSLKEGTITGLIGQNGAGKSTAFKIILGLLPFDSGRVEIFGKDLKKEGTAYKSRIGAALAETGFGGHTTVKQAASILSAAYGSMDKDAFLNSCCRWGLPLDKKLKEFSTGMKAKFKVLSAISHQAQLLILDEPTAGLDVISRDEILDILRDYMETEGRGILISSHISSDLEGLCDDVYMLHEGNILLHEDTDVILSQYGILKAEEALYQVLDKEHILRVKKESYGYCCLTDQRQFYEENYPSLIVEKCGIDEIEVMLVRGNRK